MDNIKNTNLVFMPYKLFEVNNNKYVYTQENLIFEVDERTLKIIEKSGNTYNEIFSEVSNLFTEKEFDDLIFEMNQQKFIIQGQSTIENRKSNLSISCVTIMLVQSCNMACKYCYAEEGVYNDEGKMDFDTAVASVEFLLRNAADEDSLGIILFGGEPLMAFPVIRELVTYIRNREKEINKKIYINMTTNGTLITKEIEEFFDVNRVHMMISIDGNKNTHDKNRYFKNHQGSYDLVMEKTKNLRAQRKVTARATVSTGEQDLSEIFNHLYKEGFKSIAISPAYNLFEKGDFIGFKQHQLEYVKDFLTLAQNDEYEKCKAMKMTYTQLKKINDYAGTQRCYSCGAGRTMIAVDINGDVYPCHRFVSFKEFVLGNIKTKIVREEFLEKLNMDNGHKKCSDCWIKNLCVGSCPYSNYEFTKDIAVADDKICDIEKAVFQKLIEVYLELSIGQKKSLFGEAREG